MDSASQTTPASADPPFLLHDDGAGVEHAHDHRYQAAVLHNRSHYNYFSVHEI
jgi:hypothetical protein